MFSSNIFFKSMQKFNLSVLMILLSIGSYYNVYAQDERFKGGAADGAAETSLSSVNFNDVNFVGNNLTVQVDLAVGQVDPTDISVVNFSVTFSEPVIEFTPDDVSLGGTSSPQTVLITGSGTDYNVAVSGMQTNGTVIIEIPEESVQNSVGNPNQVPTYIDNEVLYTGADVAVEITLAGGQSDPTNSSPINFTATFSGDVTGFTDSDVTIDGTAGATTVVVTGGPDVYNIAVSGMTSDGSVNTTIEADVCIDTYGNDNSASVNTAIVISSDISTNSCINCNIDSTNTSHTTYCNIIHIGTTAYHYSICICCTAYGNI